MRFYPLPPARGYRGDIDEVIFVLSPCAGGLRVDAYIFLDIVTIPFLYERTMRRRTQTHRKLPPACGHRVDIHNVTHIPPPARCRPTKPHLCPFYPRRSAVRYTRLTIHRNPIPIPEESGLSPIRVPHAHNAAKYPLEVAVREAHHAPYSLCLAMHFHISCNKYAPCDA